MVKYCDLCKVISCFGGIFTALEHFQYLFQVRKILFKDNSWNLYLNVTV